MITSLLGRKIVSGYSNEQGTVVAVFQDRGEIKLIIENPDNRMYETNVMSVALGGEACTSA